MGPPVAAARAEPVLERGRATIGRLLGVPPDGVAYVGSASEALDAVLGAWPLGASAGVGVVAAEWGPNLAAFSARGLQLVELPAELDGRLDLAGLERIVATEPPSIVHLTQVTSHRALVQPVAEAVAICHRAGVPVWVDAAQAFGHVDTATGADVVYATSRKWMCGPRGVGVLGVAEQWWPALRLRPSVLTSADLPPMRAVEPSEAHIAGRLGLCDALDRYLDVGPERMWARLDDVGRMTRALLAETPGWQVVDGNGVGVQGAITALRPMRGQDVAATRDRLLEEFGIVTTAALPVRAPGDMDGPLLRVSPHADCRERDLAGFRAVLAGL
jgi:pyridoxal 5-phosphate dependent beta-lyase